MNHLCIATVFACLCGLAPAGASADDKRPMTPIDLLEVPSLGDPQLSPDGSQLLYVLAETDWKANKQIRHVWRVGMDGTGSVQLTNGIKGEQNPRWSPDGKLIAFIAERATREEGEHGRGERDEDDEENQIYLLGNAGGEAQRLSDHETSVSSIAWSVDGKLIYFLASDPKTKREKKREQAKDDVEVFDEDYKQTHLWAISVAERKEQRVTEGDYSIRGYRLSRDGSHIVFHRTPTPLYDDSDEGEVWVMKADGKEPVRLTENTVPEFGAELSPDHTMALFLSDSNDRFESYYNDNVFTVPAKGGVHRLLLPEMPHEVRSATWSADGSSIYFLANTGVRTELFVTDLATEKLKQLTRGDHSIDDWSYDPKLDRHVFTVSDPANAGDVWTLSAANSSTLTRITHVFDYLDQEFLLPRAEAIQWKGADGMTVEGLLYYPLDYEKGKAYPLVVNTHGGPASADQFRFESWSRYVQVLAAKGYLNLKPNYRGSTGYGDRFLRDMVGHYYRQSHLDVMTGVDHLIELGIADADRMVKMGWSAGGHMTNKVITFTDRFKAASSGAGAVNWISMYGQSDVRIYRTPWFGGTPWQKDAPIDTYWEHSPLSDIHKVTTPTLVLVGAKDVRVPPPQSVELYRALKTNGVPTHLYIAPREPHGWRELRHRLFKINVELEWFERYAMGREHEWVEAPSEVDGDEDEEEHE